MADIKQIKIGNTSYDLHARITDGPLASGTQAGLTIVYPAASCTSFSSDSGTVTPLAVQKGAKMFAITRPSSSTAKAITRYSDATGNVQDSKIIIEDVTNTKDTSKKAQVIAIPAEGNKKMVYGYCTDQVDGTSFIGGIFDKDATSYPYASGLAIGGTSGNLLWKGTKVAVISDIPSSLKNPQSLTIQGNGTTLTNGVYDGSAAKTVNITPSSIGAATSSHKHAASHITSGTLGVARGGTGITSNPSMLTNLGSTSAASVFAASPRPGITGTLGLGNGGTGATTAAAARTNLGITSGDGAPSGSSAGEGSIYFQTGGDAVVATGTEGIWTWRKWASGIAECWGVQAETKSHYTTGLGGYGYYGGINLPKDLFISAPTGTYNVYIGSGFAIAARGVYALASASTMNWYAIGTSGNSQSVIIDLSLKGRWK